MAIAYTYGWHVRSEVLSLERRQLDLRGGTLRLEPGTTKNRDGRVVYLTPELNALLAAQVERVDKLQKKLERVIPHLFLATSRALTLASSDVASGRLGSVPVAALACRGASCTTSGVPPSATWSVRASRARWR